MGATFSSPKGMNACTNENNRFNTKTYISTAKILVPQRLLLGIGATKGTAANYWCDNFAPRAPSALPMIC